ncbi:MAG: hypothetical protein J7527_11795 [Chitinophagaceae bacterium]|nr:hypothetical protein [Chitinophagaceae bacterium]
MSNAVASYSFTVNSNGKNHDFAYEKAKFGIKTMLPLLWPAFPIAAIIASKTASSIAGGIFQWVFYTLALAVGGVFLVNMFRKGGTFTIGESGVTLNGRTYNYQDIHSFYVKSPKGEKMTVIVQNNIGAGYGVHGAMNATGNAIGAMSGAARESLKSSLREKNYKVCMLFGEKEIVLAGGLTDKSAKVLLERIDSLI